MTKHLLRFAAFAAAVVCAHPVAAQELPAPLPWGINGAQVASALEARELTIVLTRAGRDVHAASANRHTQAVAILTNDSLVGLVYFHPENAHLNALDLFSQAAAQAERAHGPPACRTSAVAVWPVEQGVLEVRLRRPSGDGAPGAEIRYAGPGYAEEMARRTRPAAPRRPASSSTSRRSGPRLLGTPADSVAAPPPAEAAASPVEAAPPAAAVPSVTASCGGTLTDTAAASAATGG
jgi:hypothetical protein